MSAATDLVFRSGALEGTRVELDPKEPLRMGRKRGGFDLEDPLVSLEHAVIEFQKGRYYIVDVGSMSGTRVNGQVVGRGAIPLSFGDVIEIGEARIDVVERPVHTFVRMVLVVCIILASMPIVFRFVQVRARGYEPVLMLRNVVKGEGAEHVWLRVPTDFIRRQGIDHRRLRHTATTDVDADGIDEVWLSGPKYQYPIEVRADGSWDVMGEIPVTCIQQAGSTEQPLFDCGGVRWSFRKGSYAPRRLDGVVIWGRSERGDQPVVVKLADEASLVGWLDDRGINEPVHYIVCEGWIPGAPAQVLTESGAVRRLTKGCLKDVSVSADGLSEAAPRAIALTAAGLGALYRDAAVHLSGGPAGSFLSGHEAKLLGLIGRQAEPTTRGKVAFRGAPLEGAPAAPERPVAGSRALVRNDGDGLEPVVKAQLLSSGRASISGGGCVRLEVTTSDWTCQLLRGCRSGGDFLTVDEVGCGPRQTVLVASYQNGVFRGETDQVEVLASIDSMVEGWRTDVLRTEIYVRPKGK